MTKRKMGDRNNSSDNHYRKRYRKINLENAPDINTLKDLIDIGKNIKFYKNIDTMLLWHITPYLEELDNMIGMNELKQTIFYQIIYYLQGMHSRNGNEEYLHTVILGPPGVGKTKVSRIIGKIYQSMGILSTDGVFKIAYRDDFVAEYLGQSAIKTRKLLKSCIGGVLFIDEVYALGPGSNDKDSFSKEAIDTLTSFLSEHKNDFCCIIAGYEEDIKKCFFSVNKGLERRFPWTHAIKPYTSKELALITFKIINDINWNIEVTEEELTEILENNKDYFKYAGGDIENYITKCKMSHAKRVLTLPRRYKFFLTIEDMKEGMVMFRDVKIKEKNDNDKSIMSSMYS